MNINFTNAVKQSAATGKQIRGVHFTFAAPVAIEVLSHADLQFTIKEKPLKVIWQTAFWDNLSNQSK